MEQKLLPNDVRWLRPDEFPLSGAYTATNGITVYAIGEEADRIVTFQDVDTADFVAAVFEYEIKVEQYDACKENGISFIDYAQDVEIVALELMTPFGEWFISWAADNPRRDVLALMLTRW